eukprot:1936081-Amphidinium_carterae.1
MARKQDYPISMASGTPITEENQQVLSSLDYTGAFLNAELPEGRMIVLRPLAVFVWLGVIPPNTLALASCPIWTTRVPHALGSNP